MGNGVFLTIPDKITSKSQSIRWMYDNNGVPVLSDDGIALAEVTLPRGTQVRGEDVSFYRFTIRKTQLDPGGQRFLRTHSILLPRINQATGDEWQVTLTRNWWRKDQSGTPVVERTRKVVCTSSELRQALRESYRNYLKWRDEKEHAAEACSAGKDSRESLHSRMAAAKQMSADRRECK